jgi:hypothetical protein
MNRRTLLMFFSGALFGTPRHDVDGFEFVTREAKRLMDDSLLAGEWLSEADVKVFNQRLERILVRAQESAIVDSGSCFCLRGLGFQVILRKGHDNYWKITGAIGPGGAEFSANPTRLVHINDL